MGLTAAIRTRLSADSGVNTLVGVGAAAHIYPKVAPSGAPLPRITHQMVADVGPHHQAGASGVARETRQIDCWASDDDGAEALARVVRICLDGFAGAIGAVTVRFIALSGQVSSSEPLEEGSQSFVSRVRMEFAIDYVR